jgi:hypothetical protein
METKKNKRQKDQYERISHPIPTNVYTCFSFGDRAGSRITRIVPFCRIWTVRGAAILLNMLPIVSKLGPSKRLLKNSASTIGPVYVSSDPFMATTMAPTARQTQQFHTLRDELASYQGPGRGGVQGIRGGSEV